MVCATCGCSPCICEQNARRNQRGWAWDSPDCACEAVGLSQIAERLGVQRETAVRWNYRKLLPQPQWRVSRDPAWCWPHQIVPWAERTGRLPVGQ